MPIAGPVSPAGLWNVSERLDYQSIQMKQQRIERTSQLGSRIFSDRRPKLRQSMRQSISRLWASQDTNQDGSILVLLYVIACLVAVNLILRLPGAAAMTLDQLSQIPLCGP